MDSMYKYEIRFGMVSYGMDYFDPSNLVGGLWHSGGRHAWVNEEFDALVDEAGPLMDMKKRSELYKKAQHILSEDVGGIFLWHRTPAHMYKPYVVGPELEPDRYGVATCHWPCFESIGTSPYGIYVSKEVEKYPPRRR